jgi:hypothetical protein
MASFFEPRYVACVLLAMASGVGLATPAQAVVPALDLDQDGLKDVLEPRVGLTPGHRDKIAFVDAGSLAGRCSDQGSDERLGAPRRPWCTLGPAVEEAPAGTTVLVRRGIYELEEIERMRLGRVRLRPYPGERVTLRGLTLTGGRVRLERFRITAPVEISARSRRVSLIGNRFMTRTGAIQIAAGVRHVLIARNRIAQRRGADGANAINFSSTDTLRAIVDVTIRGNRIGPVPTGGDAIQAKHTRGLVIEGNEIFGVRRPRGSKDHPDAFQSIYGAEGLTLRRNFIHDIAAQGILVERYRGENRGLRVEDNVIARVAYPWVPLSFSARGAKLIHNTVLGTIRTGHSTRRAVLVGNIASTLLLPPGTGVARRDHNLVGGRPQFRNAGRNDFRLRRGSPGRRRGPGRTDIGSRTGNWSRGALARR